MAVDKFEDYSVVYAWRKCRQCGVRYEARYQRVRGLVGEVKGAGKLARVTWFCRQCQPALPFDDKLVAARKRKHTGPYSRRDPTPA